MNRRSFIKSIGLSAGAFYLNPFLQSLDAASGIRPARVLFFLQANGLYPRAIAPSGIPYPGSKGNNSYGTNPTLLDQTLDGQTLPFSLEPLQPHIDKLTYLHGLSGTLARAGHGMGYAALGYWPSDKRAFGETIDMAMANKLGGIFKHVGLGVSNATKGITFDVTSAARNKPMPTILNPVLAYDKLFKAGLKGQAAQNFRSEKQLIDFMAGDVKRARRELVGDEKEKLDRFVEAFEAMGGRHEKLVSVSPKVSRAMPRSFDPHIGQLSRKKGEFTGVFDRLDAQFSNAGAAFMAGLTNVVTVSASCGLGSIGIGCTGKEVDAALLGGDEAGFIPAHSIGHGGGALGLASQQAHDLIRRKCMEKLANFITKMESIPEGDGTMMDNTLIVFLSDSAEGHHPVCRQWPFLMIGDLGGRLRAGNRYIHYPHFMANGHKTISNFYLTLLHAIGDHRERFGMEDSKLRDLDANGPLHELLA